MRLLVDAGNTRLKWRLERDGVPVEQGAGRLDDDAQITAVLNTIDGIESVAVSTVASEERQERLQGFLKQQTAAPVTFYWAERTRGGLVNAYKDVARMGADRWHAMYGAWASCRQGFAVVDAGSAVTVDYVDASGRHLGGFILPGLQMMLRSLKTDAARIGFDPAQILATDPGRSTGECVNHGLAWLSAGMVERIERDVREYALGDIVVTGGDADRLLGLGLRAQSHPGLVLDGLGLIDSEERGA